jgi:DNA-binding response OmpR family regulator
MALEKILVVDDEEIVCLTLSEILKLEGFLVDTARDGAHALKLLAKERYEIMIIDLKMPGVSGMDVIHKAADEYPKMDIIILTAFGSMETAIEALRYRVEDYLIKKPAEPEIVVESVHKLMAERALRSSGDGNSAALEKGHVTRLERGVFQLPGGIILDCNKRLARWNDGEVEFTATEGKVLLALIEQTGRLVTHPDLVMAVHGFRVSSEEEGSRILRPIMSRLRKKLEDVPGGENWVKNIRGAGYLIEFKPAG